MRATKSKIQQLYPARTWHTLDIQEVADFFKVVPTQGLSKPQILEQFRRYGKNVIAEQNKRGFLRILFSQFADFMIIILLLASMVSAAIGEAEDTLTIVIIVVLNAILGFIQEYRAEKAIQALKRLTPLRTHVRRNGEIEEIDALDLVPGDIVLLEAGMIIPADIRLLEASQLNTIESALTGESQPSEKLLSTLQESDLPVGDRANMVFKGTHIATGRGSGIVIATGMQTEIGKIAALLQDEHEHKTPLQHRLAKFGRKLALGVLLICIVIFTLGIMRNESPTLMLMTAISLAVAAIPESLPAVVTIALALGARRMATKNVLIRRLPAVETLGSITYICTDKTGTLTENRMQAVEYYYNQEFVQNPLELGANFLKAIGLNHDIVLTNHQQLVGDPTEIALYQVAEQAGFDTTILRNMAPRIDEVPFDSERRRMTTLHQTQNLHILYTKGAPEVIFPLCTSIWTQEGQKIINLEKITTATVTMANKGLRVLAIAEKTWKTKPTYSTPTELENNLCLLGLIGLMDPPRVGVKQAVYNAQAAGITPVMLTGDHRITALAIAQQLNIASVTDGQSLSGRELNMLSDAEFEKCVENIRVYARVSPEQKIKIVQTLQDKGHFVAMTGDGVNDAPALRRADIGIAMGNQGTDVAREAAHMVLLDDNFASIVRAVSEGRRIYDNIRKFIKYVMTGNSAEIWTLLLAPLLLLPVPLLPIHILWINLVTDGLPGIALTMEPPESDLMKRPPRVPDESILAQGMWQHMLVIGLFIAGITLGVHYWAQHQQLEHWQSMVFTVLTFSQMWHVLAIRSEHLSVFQQNFFSNTYLLGAVLFTFLLQLMILYTPVLNPIFKTAALSQEELMLCIGLSSLVFVVVEIEKWLRRSGWIYRA